LSHTNWLLRDYEGIYRHYIFHSIPSTSVGPKFYGLAYKSRAKWKMLQGVYGTIYGEVNVSISVCVEIKGDYIEK